MKKELCRFKNGDTIYQDGSSVVCLFCGNRRVLSTSALNGGLREDLRSVYNHDCYHGNPDPEDMLTGSLAEHTARTAQSLGLDPSRTAGLMTAAYMDNTAVAAESYDDTRVTAVVTAGIDENAGRVGDPAFWHESRDGYIMLPGTINIILYIEASLSPGTLTRALVTCTEAKSAAIEELQLPSKYSSGIATGSGTDGTIVICDPNANTALTEAGKHFKLGELIGRAVMRAVKQALFLQTGAAPERQLSVFARLERFGITREFFPKADSAALDRLDKDAELVAASALLTHLLDELSWGMLPPGSALRIGAGLIARFDGHAHTDLDAQDASAELLRSLHTAISYRANKTV